MSLETTKSLVDSAVDKIVLDRLRSVDLLFLLLGITTAYCIVWAASPGPASPSIMERLKHAARPWRR